MGEARNYWEHLIDSTPNRLARVIDLDSDMIRIENLSFR
jgi:hypothetical protein